MFDYSVQRTDNFTSLYLIIKVKGFLVGPSEIAPELEKNYSVATEKLHTVSPIKKSLRSLPLLE
jgi:hypothetical protein